MVALFIAFAVVVALLIAFWRTMHDQASRGLEPTEAEHAAADAGRTGPTGTVGQHDTLATGPPAFLDDVRTHDGGSFDVR
jgi:hypothetical protein